MKADDPTIVTVLTIECAIARRAPGNGSRLPDSVVFRATNYSERANNCHLQGWSMASRSLSILRCRVVVDTALSTYGRLTRL